MVSGDIIHLMFSSYISETFWTASQAISYSSAPQYSMSDILQNRILDPSGWFLGTG